MAEEVRTTSVTGGEKGVKLAQFSLLPMEALREVAEHYGVGAKKYEKHNMRKGYEWSKSFDAAMRHLTQFWAGEDRDEETGSKHLAAVVFHALTLMEFMETHREFDDRYKPDEGEGKKERFLPQMHEGESLSEYTKRLTELLPNQAVRAHAGHSVDYDSIIDEHAASNPARYYGSGLVIGGSPLDYLEAKVVPTPIPTLRQMEEEQVRRITQESYDAWDAGRPFGRFEPPTSISKEKK